MTVNLIFFRVSLSMGKCRKIYFFCWCFGSGL